MPDTAHARDPLTDYRLKTIEDAVKSIADNLSQLTVLEQKHVETREALGRAFLQIDDHDERIRTVETEMPTLKMIRGWVIAGVIGIVALVGIAFVNLIVSAKPPISTPQQPLSK
jgi:hypothetical protein